VAVQQNLRCPGGGTALAGPHWPMAVVAFLNLLELEVSAFNKRSSQSFGQHFASDVF